METTERRIEFIEVTTQDRREEVRKLFLEYAASLNVDLCFQDFETELRELPGKYAPPGGTLILACVDGEIAGCAALRKITGEICEMKRLYVRTAFRGLGIGKALAERIIKEAVRLRYRFLRLDTLPMMETAQNLYRSLGFLEIGPYVYNPVEGTKFMELIL